MHAIQLILSQRTKIIKVVKVAQTRGVALGTFVILKVTVSLERALKMAPRLSHTPKTV